MGSITRGRGGQALILAGLLFLLVFVTVVHVRLWPTPTEGEDVYYAWVEGGRILAGENPYARVLAGDMRQNDKYATYFPVFYALSALTQRLGLADYPAWIAFWRVIFLLFTLATGLLLFALPARRGQTALAFFALAFWLFNRWTLHVTQIAHLDPLPIFLLIASLALFRRRRTASLLLFSLSLGVKQIAVFLVPLYLIWAWQESDGDGRDRARATVRAALLIASVPLVASLPFLAWNAEGFVKSVLFSATRLPSDHFAAPSFDGHMGWLGIPAKLPMLALMALALWLAWRRKIGRATASLLVMACFVDFNSVLFRQYLAWVVPLLPLAVLEMIAAREKAQAPSAPLVPAGADYWHRLDELVQASEIVIDRPRGSAHPRYPAVIYPLDYGYLAGTTAADGGGIDVWRGSAAESRVTGVISTVDLFKRDAETKILLGCTPDEAQVALATHRTGSQAATLTLRPPC